MILRAVSMASFSISSGMSFLSLTCREGKDGVYEIDFGFTCKDHSRSTTFAPHI